MTRMNSKNAMIWMIAGFMCLGASEAVAQIGPDLRPPGLENDHPLESYTMTGHSAADDWRHEAAWELNASDVVFSASKKRQLISEAPSTIHVITDKDIAKHGWRSLPDVLRHVPGVQTITIDSQFHSVMIRGLVGTDDNNSRILWLQNGVPMNDVRDSGIWLDETYPVEMIKRIEVVLGPGSSLYGAGAFQGVINIFTKDPKDIGKYGEYKVSLQNNLTFKASAIAAYNSEDSDLGILIHASGNTTQGPGLIGDYSYNKYLMDTAASSVGNAKDADYTRFNRMDSNSDKHWYDLNFKLNYDMFKWQLGFSDIYAGADGSELTPGVGYTVTDSKDYSGVINKEIDPGNNYRFNRREFYNDFILEKNIGEEATVLGVVSYRFMQYNHKHYDNLSGSTDMPYYMVQDPLGNTQTIKSSALPDGFEDKINFTENQHKLYLLGQFQWRIYDENELIAGLGIEYNHISSPIFSTYNTPNYNKDGDLLSWNEYPEGQKMGYVNPYLFIQDEQRAWHDRLIFTLGVRADFYKVNNIKQFSGNGDREDSYSELNHKASGFTDNEYFAPSMRLAFLAKWTDWMTMRISIGNAFKNPSPFQFYADTFDYLPGLLGEDGLKREKIHNIELSLAFTPTYFLSFRLDGFASYMQDLISYEYVSSEQKSSVVSYGSFGSRFIGELGKYRAIQNTDAWITGFEFSLNAKLNTNWDIYTHYNFLYSKMSNTENGGGFDENIVDDARHRFKLGFSYVDEHVSADLATFLVSSSPATDSVFVDAKNQLSSVHENGNKYSNPFYAILQPAVTVGLPANLGFSVQGSMVLSENMLSSPTYRYYYETEAVPVSRYSVMFSLVYPFRETEE